MSLKKVKIKDIKLSNIAEHISSWWKHYYRIIFILSMIISMIAGVYFWNLNLNNNILSDQERSDYKTIKDKSVEFEEKDFYEAIEYINQRELNYSKNVFEGRDIFK